MARPKHPALGIGIITLTNGLLLFLIVADSSGEKLLSGVLIFLGIFMLLLWARNRRLKKSATHS